MSDILLYAISILNEKKEDKHNVKQQQKHLIDLFYHVRWLTGLPRTLTTIYSLYKKNIYIYFIIAYHQQQNAHVKGWALNSVNLLCIYKLYSYASTLRTYEHTVRKV